MWFFLAFWLGWVRDAYGRCHAVLIGHKNAISVTQHMLSRLIQDYKVRASG